MREFVDRNDATFTHSAGGLGETAKMIEDVAAALVSEAEFIAWVVERLK
jgi:hypothetical protein